MSSQAPENGISQEIVYTMQTEVACDGDTSDPSGALGHPRVFLHMENGQVECPYCDKLFIHGEAPAEG